MGNDRDPVRIGFVGVGSMGQCAHLRNYTGISDCRVVAISEPRPELAQRVASRYNIPQVFPNAQSMLESMELDGIVASQPFDRHGSLVAPLFAFGKPIFTEKPLASSVDQGLRMLNELKKGGSWHMVGYHKRCDPATEVAKAEIDRLKATGELGKLCYIRICIPPGDWIASGFTDLITSHEQSPNVEPDPPDPMMSPSEFQSYVNFINYYIHQVNLLRHLLGESYRVTFVDVNQILMVVESASGVTGTIELGPYATTIDWQESALIAFERGTIKLTLPAPLATHRAGSVEFFRDPGHGERPETIIPQLPWIHAMSNQALQFIRTVRSERRAPCEASEALEDLIIARSVTTFQPPSARAS